MRRLIRFMIMTVLATLFVSWIATVDAVQGQVTYPNRYSISYDWRTFLDTTTAKKKDTLNYRKNAANTAFTTQRILQLLDAGGMTRIQVQWRVGYITPFDTGSAAADIVDSSKDTVQLAVIAIDRVTQQSKIIWVDTMINMWKFGTFGTSADSSPAAAYRTFVIPRDSSYLDNIYFRLIYSVQDSDYSVARAGAGMRLRAMIRVWGS